MKWLTIDYIKEHSRIDYDCENAALELYGSAAEDTILSVVRRTLENVKDKWGAIPPAFYQAALMLTDLGYQNRSPISVTNMSVVPYTFDMLIAEYMRYDKATDLEEELEYLLEIMDEAADNLDYDYNDLDEPTEAQTAAYEELVDEYETKVEKYSAIEKPTTAICEKVRTAVADFKTRCASAL